ncbi:hypothetical protein [Mycobacteroides sp. PCS013]|uniref:hypothetical protein n=1 Tax=Mycobacteroides sp. PCS013 TaxID=3074106 RepID=UPI003C2BFCA4
MVSTTKDNHRIVYDFFRDWVVFAPLPVTAAIFASALTLHNVVGSEISNGALISYSLALCWAFLDDVKYVQEDTMRSLRIAQRIIPFMKWAITVVGFLLTGMLAAGHVFEKMELLSADQVASAFGTVDRLVIISGAMALITFMLACCALWFRLAKPRKEMG